MPGLCHSNGLISRDEGLHTEFTCLLYTHINQKPPIKTVLSIITEAVELEKEFASGGCACILSSQIYIDMQARSLESLSIALIGMNATLMGEYIEFVADCLLVMLGYSKVFSAENPVRF
jgi:ribonucleotide reductase beta subunit family protein with ferritin-like domain